MTDRINLVTKVRNVVKIIVANSVKRTEIIKLNVENSNLLQEQQRMFCKIGEYVAEKEMLAEDEVVSNLKSDIIKISEDIEENQKKVRKIREIVICPNCGVEVSEKKKLCPKCGIEILDFDMRKDSQKGNTQGDKDE